MIPERLKRLYQRKREQPAVEQPRSCIGFYDRGGVFGFTTYTTNVDRERILAELQASGSSVVGVMSDVRARRLAIVDSTRENYPKFSS